MARLKAELNPKHLKALELIRSGKHTLKEVAKLAGFSEGYFYDLVEGNVHKTTTAAVLFQEEIKKIEKGLTQRIRYLTKDTQERLLTKFNEIIKNIKTKPSEKTLANFISIMNALNKSTPGIEIGSLSYAQGYTAEDLVNEFRRLKAIASDGNRISGIGPREPGYRTGLTSERSIAEEVAETPVLRTES